MGSSDEADREGAPRALDDTLPADSLPPEPRRSSPTLPPPPGQERYQLKSELGRGGMGRVVEALDIQLGRVVAVKEVLPKAGKASARRFEREVALTARLEHPSIVPLYDSGTTADGRPYYVMRRVSGRPLDELIARARRFEDRLAYLPAVQQAVDAVAHAHRRGVIHRDLKPANILIGELGETVVIDWGLAKVIGESEDPASRDSLPSDSLQTQMGSVFGTPGFMAPEQARGEEIGPHGDVYALGATLYQLLAGVPPHAGTSATAVLEKTLKHAVTPLAQLVPGVPPELVTIVNKALAPDAIDRYPDAGALGEDLRRFLTGQLVAAHRYTPGQHLARFARRHRTALVVAALSLVAFAAFAVFSVVRILQERDAANAARAEAIAGRSAAEQAKQALEDRHYALLVANARARLDANPTAALATIKLVPPTSALHHEARAVAQAAVMRGVSWALRSTLDFTVIAQLSPDAKRMVQVSRDGVVRVWDLELRRLELERPFAAATRAVWLAGGKLLVTHDDATPVILDPRANTVENVDAPPFEIAFSAANGERAVFVGRGGGGIFDAATRTAKLFPDKVRSVAIASDGKLAVYTGDAGTVIVDGDGKELARLPKQAMRIALSTARTVAVVADNKVHEIVLDAPNPAFVEVQRAWAERDIVLDIAYRGRELVVVAGLSLWGWTGERTVGLGKLESLTSGIAIAGDSVIALSTDNKLHLIGPQLHASVQLPANLVAPRLVARPDASRVLVVARGIVLAVELDAIRPRSLRVPAGTHARFVDDDTLLASDQQGWRWIDVASGTTTPIDYVNLALANVEQIEVTGRVLVADHGPFGRRMLLLEKGSAEARVIAEGRNVWARFVGGNAVVFNTGDSRVMVSIDGLPPRELVKMTGKPDGAISLGHRRVALHSSSGELIRADLASGHIERTTIPLGTRFLMAADLGGRVVLAEDKRVLVWDGTIKEVATFDKPVFDLHAVQGGVAVVVQDFETYLVDLQGSPPRRLFAASRSPPAIAFDGRLAVGIGNAEQFDVVELPGQARWTIPKFRGTFLPQVAVSPSKRRIVQQEHDHFVVWQLPHAPVADLGAWLDEHTNARIDTNGEVVWPWQMPSGP